MGLGSGAEGGDRSGQDAQSAPAPPAGMAVVHLIIIDTSHNKGKPFHRSQLTDHMTAPARTRIPPRRPPSIRLPKPTSGRRVDQPDMIPKLQELINSCGGDTNTRDGQLAQDLLLTTLKLVTDPTGTGERKLMTNSFKELRHAFRIFASYPDTRKISIFGSARTPLDHPDYQTAVKFSRLMADQGWLVITGAGDGIMKAGHEGPGAKSSFGLSIHLPFETTANSVIAGDEKLLKFRYFFTRKLMFLSQCDAVVAFPGGFGTQDELLEALTLIQTGKSSIVPVVMLSGGESRYWEHWDRYVQDELVSRGFIGPQDQDLYYLASSAQDAAAHIEHFYLNYHSSRYVRDELVIRIKQPLLIDQIAELNKEFTTIVKSGEIKQQPAYPVEDEYLDLTRITFTHKKGSYATVRHLINRINDYSTQT